MENMATIGTLKDKENNNSPDQSSLKGQDKLSLDGSSSSKSGVDTKNPEKSQGPFTKAFAED
jgi:hypothetical protein